MSDRLCCLCVTVSEWQALCSDGEPVCSDEEDVWDLPDGEEGEETEEESEEEEDVLSESCSSPKCKVLYSVCEVFCHQAAVARITILSGAQLKKRKGP